MIAKFEIKKPQLSGVAIVFQKIDCVSMVVGSEISCDQYTIQITFENQNKAFDFFHQLGLTRVEVIMSHEIKGS